MLSISQEVKVLLDFQSRDEQEEAVQLLLCGKNYELEVISCCVIRRINLLCNTLLACYIAKCITTIMILFEIYI